VELVEIVKATLLRNLRFSGVLGLSCVDFHLQDLNYNFFVLGPPFPRLSSYSLDLSVCWPVSWSSDWTFCLFVGLSIGLSSCLLAFWWTLCQFCLCASSFLSFV